MRKILLLVALLIVGGITLPLWGSCDLNQRACATWCKVRHFNAEVQRAACLARCTTEKSRCLLQEGVEKVQERF